MADYEQKWRKTGSRGKNSVAESSSLFRSSLKLNPEDQDIMYSLSKIYLNLGRNADAEKMNKMMDQAKAKGQRRSNSPNYNNKKRKPKRASFFYALFN